MQITGKITDWQLRSASPGKRTWMRYNAATDEIEIMEEWLNEVPIREAAIERELAGGRKGGFLQPIAVIPNSERSRAIREGWDDDDMAWKRWMNDIDNRYLRITDGRV
ncbi:MAG: hypothetical protein IT537_25320 [Hyphomicrobiales bacterium]|nr:hypothetical protein [Hyphomicrobiales bacterium]